jgi:hypothetical protein
VFTESESRGDVHTNFDVVFELFVLPMLSSRSRHDEDNQRKKGERKKATKEKKRTYPKCDPNLTKRARKKKKNTSSTTQPVTDHIKAYERDMWPAERNNFLAVLVPLHRTLLYAARGSIPARTFSGPKNGLCPIHFGGCVCGHKAQKSQKSLFVG